LGDTSPIVPQSFGHIAQIGRKNRRAFDFIRGDRKLDQNLRTIATERSDLDPFSKQRALAGFQITGQSFSMLLAHLRRDNEFDQFFAERFRATKPNTRSAAGLNSRTRPLASMVMMQSNAESRIARLSASTVSAGLRLLLRFCCFYRTSSAAPLNMGKASRLPAKLPGLIRSYQFGV
jgi:hypothetical protein